MLSDAERDSAPLSILTKNSRILEFSNFSKSEFSRPFTLFNDQKLLIAKIFVQSILRKFRQKVTNIIFSEC